MKRLSLNLLLICCSLAVSLEVAGFTLGLIRPRLFDYARQSFTHDPNITPERLNEFLATAYSPLTGWQPRKDKHFTEENCTGTPIDYDLDASGVRTYSGYDPTQAVVLIGGDSYSWGEEIKNNDTIAARFFVKTGIVAANLAYRAYDPVQSFLHIQSERNKFPAAKVVVIDIMYENINRMMTSYFYLYRESGQHLFSFKPYMKEGKIQPLDPHAYDSIDTFRQAAERAFSEDYWAKPQYQFPYSLALLHAISSHAFIDLHVMKWLTPFDHQYIRQYLDPDLGDNLFHLLTLYGDWAKSENVIPVVVFIPQNSHDIDSPEYWIKRYRDRLPGNLIVQNLNFATMPFDKYKIRQDNNVECHPSAYGADFIAGQLSEIVTPLLFK